jgi:hypothetical protein
VGWIVDSLNFVAIKVVMISTCLSIEKARKNICFPSRVLF